MTDFIEKIASLRPSQKLALLADATEKLAAHRDGLLSENRELATKLAALERRVALEDLYHQLEKRGNPWETREETLANLEKMARDGKLEGFVSYMSIQPGAMGKIASGLDETRGGESGSGSQTKIAEARQDFVDTVMSSGSGFAE